MCILCDPLTDLNALIILSIINCHNITFIPDGLINVQSVSIHNCPNLTRLSSDMINIVYLYINNCPLLTSIPRNDNLVNLYCYSCPFLTFISPGMNRLRYFGEGECPLLYIPYYIRGIVYDTISYTILKSSSNIVRIRSAQFKAKKLYTERILKIKAKLMETPLYPVQQVIIKYMQ